MFAKLLKYEWRATSKTLGILSLAALAAGGLGALLLRLMLADAGKNPILMVFAMVMLLGIMLALIAYGIAVSIFLLARFYRNKFTDEGYLTFTLPVTSHELVLSTLVNELVWSVITCAVIFVSLGMILFVGTAQTGVVNWEFLDGMRVEFAGVRGSFMDLSAGTAVLSAVSVVVSVIATPLMAMAAITIGASIAQKHKILTAFGIYYGTNMAVGTLNNTAKLAMSFGNDVVTGMQISMAFQLLIYLTLAVGSYFVTTHFMRNKLNLA